MVEEAAIYSTPAGMEAAPATIDSVSSDTTGVATEETEAGK